MSGAARPRGITRADLMTPEEVTELLAVPPKTVLHWARIGYVPGVKLGRRWRFLRDDVEAWVRASRRDAA